MSLVTLSYSTLPQFKVRFFRTAILQSVILQSIIFHPFLRRSLCNDHFLLVAIYWYFSSKPRALQGHDWSSGFLILLHGLASYGEILVT